jgi:uncharacterized protein DUF5995
VSIDALIGRMEELLGPLQEAGDPRRYFHATYLRTTRAVRDALKAGLFSDPDWVERWDVAFADLYLDALRADSAGGPVPGPWAIAFRTGRERPDAPALRHVLLGMNAHINYDLPQALLAVISGPEFTDPVLLRQRRGDHQRIDEVLSQRVGAEDAELTSAAPRSTTDTLLAPLNQAASRRFLREARAKVWDNTMELNAARSLGAAAYAERLGDLEVLSADRVADLVKPGQVLFRLAVHGFGVRLVAPGSRGRRGRGPGGWDQGGPGQGGWGHGGGQAPGGGPPGSGVQGRGYRRTPGGPRSFDPALLADLELRAWVGYYRRDWAVVLHASVGLVRAGFGMSWPRTLQAAWLALRAIQLWAPADNDPAGARRCMQRFYGLVRSAYGLPGDIVEAARLEVDWWRVHRERQHGGPADQLVDAVARLYAFLYQAPHHEVRPAAAHRAYAMDLSDRWVAEGCLPGSPLLALEHAALVRSYAALLAAVHRLVAGAAEPPAEPVG